MFGRARETLRKRSKDAPRKRRWGDNVKNREAVRLMLSMRMGDSEREVGRGISC
jgi:hypothetical protein